MHTRNVVLESGQLAISQQTGGEDRMQLGGETTCLRSENGRCCRHEGAAVDSTAFDVAIPAVGDGRGEFCVVVRSCEGDWGAAGKGAERLKFQGLDDEPAQKIH